ncbi:MAG: hypothetical protein LLG06_19685 [Desulfobacteraceae bacterium]|nr:hypothetical protein [Desulfobacteraceae bacterium]
MRTIIVHTASIRLGQVEQIVAASLSAEDVRRAAKKWRAEYPGKKIKYQTIRDEVET